MTTFQTPVDIANRALQHLRKTRIFSFADASVEAQELNFAYDKIRDRELRRNVWRFATRRAILRPLNFTTQLVTFAAYAAGTTYKALDVVAFGNALWVSLVDGNLGNTPGIVPSGGVLFWDTYFGPVIGDLWNAPIVPQSNTAAGSLFTTSYFRGTLAYKTPATPGASTLYVSLLDGNSNDPAAVDLWEDDYSYTTGQVVASGGVNYQSLASLNANNVPASSPSWWTTVITSPLVSNTWRAVAGATLAAVPIIYPQGAGPLQDRRTRNAFRLPNGFLRQAPTEPKAGNIAFSLGGPTNYQADDWAWEGQYIVSQSPYPQLLRFVADVQDVTTFDAMFCEGLAACIAEDTAPRLADADHLGQILANVQGAYRRIMGEARTVNGIETGPVEPYEDGYISCRL